MTSGLMPWFWHHTAPSCEDIDVLLVAEASSDAFTSPVRVNTFDELPAAELRRLKAVD